jgi:hypothetical protein
MALSFVDAIPPCKQLRFDVGMEVTCCYIHRVQIKCTSPLECIFRICHCKYLMNVSEVSSRISSDVSKPKASLASRNQNTLRQITKSSFIARATSIAVLI